MKGLFCFILKFIPPVLLLSAWLIPLHFLPWVSWHSDALAFLAVFSLAWVAVIALLPHRQKVSVSCPTLALPFLGLALFALVQGLTGVMTFAGDVVIVCLFMALCLLCVLLGYGATRSLQDNPATSQATLSPSALLALTILLGGAISAGLAFAQAFGLWEHSQWIVRMPSSFLRRPGANMAQPNHLATLLVMGIASVVFLYHSRVLSAFSSVLALLFLGAGLAASESRTGALAFVVLLFWWFLKRPVVSKETSPWSGFAVGGGFAVLYLTWPAFFHWVHMEVYRDGARLEVQNSRYDMWLQMLEAVRLRPWFGWGIRESAEAHNSVAHGYLASEPFTYSHNFFIDIAIWVGLPVAALFMVTGVIWLWRRIQMTNQILPWYALALALPLAVHSQLEFPYAYAYFLVPVMFLLGCMEGALATPAVFRIKLPLAASALFLTSLFLVWSVVEYLETEADFRVVRFEVLRIGKTAPEYDRPNIILLTQLGALLDGARLVPHVNMTPGEVSLLADVALHYPWRAPQYSYAIALALNGDPAEASRQIQVMRGQHGEQFYAVIKQEIGKLAETKYPELRKLRLP